MEREFGKTVGSEFTVMADKGSEFTAGLGDLLAKTLRCKFSFIDERAPWSNGLCERFNRVFNDHFKKAMVDGSVLEISRWGTWLPYLTSVYNASYHQEIASTPFFVLNKREFQVNFLNVDSDNLHDRASKRRKTKEGDSYTEAEVAEQRNKEYGRVLSIIREHHAKLANTYEFSQVLAANYINLSEKELCLVHLGDSNGGMGDKFRCHAGPFQVVRRISNAQYIIQGADKLPVTVHAAKLMRYNFSYADLYGYARLASSAVGAAQSRLFRFQNSLDIEK
jgi:hypothetical protein